MAGLLACIELAVKRFEAGDATERDRSLLKKYGKIDPFSRTVKFDLPSIAKKTGLLETLLSARLNHGLGTSAAISAESKDWFSGRSTTSQSRRTTGLVHTGRGIPGKLNGHR